jgi:hypothetical protein
LQNVFAEVSAAPGVLASRWTGTEVEEMQIWGVYDLPKQEKPWHLAHQNQPVWPAIQSA